LDATVATVEAVEVALRLAAVLLTGLVTFFIAVQLYRNRIRPRVVWMYVGAVAAVTFIWRGIVLAMLFLPEVRADLLNWITPITATMYCLGAVSLFILAFCASRRRHGDE